jgi:hypothetical protein
MSVYDNPSVLDGTISIEYAGQSELQGAILDSVGQRAVRSGRAIADALTARPELGPSPFTFTSHSGESVWTNQTYTMSISESSEDGQRAFNMYIDAEEDADTLSMDQVLNIFSEVITNPPLEGARRRRNRKTRKASKKRRSTKRR